MCIYIYIYIYIYIDDIIVIVLLLLLIIIIIRDRQERGLLEEKNGTARGATTPTPRYHQINPIRPTTIRPPLPTSKLRKTTVLYISAETQTYYKSVGNRTGYHGQRSASGLSAATWALKGRKSTPTTSYSLVTEQAVARGLLTKWDIQTHFLTGATGSGLFAVVVLCSLMKACQMSTCDDLSSCHQTTQT